MKTTTLLIERYDQSIDALMQVDRRAFGSPSYSPWTIASFIRHGFVYALYELQIDLPTRPIAIMVLMSQKGNPRSTYIVGMAVDSDFQNQGMGTKIMTDVLNNLLQIGISEVTLDVSPGNENALHLYRDKFGFELAGFHFNEYGLDEDRLYLRKNLANDKPHELDRQPNSGNRSFLKLTDFENFTIDRLLFLKSALLCYGLRANRYSSELARWFNPWSTKRTGHVGIHMRLKNMIMNVPMDQIYVNEGIYTNRSPFEILPTNPDDPLKGKWILVDQEDALAEIDLITVPTWYHLKTTSGIPMTELFLQEGDGNLMGAIPGKCSYHVKGNPCLYCGFDGVENGGARPADYGEVVVKAMLERLDITITLTGGNTDTSDRGINRYLPYIREIVKMIRTSFPNLPIPKIQIECSPPSDPRVFDKLIDAGVNSFSINLEIFNEKIREKICPGKKGIPRSDYYRAWSYLVNKLREYYVGSALIFGLESKIDTLTGAMDLLSRGVRPNIIPFKPMPGSVLEKEKVPDFIGYHKICTGIAKRMKEVKVDLDLRLGCTTCGACTLEENIYKLMVVGEK